ncbi:rhodanese-like domain-containing protein [Maritimibacter harenae]|nr:rhodanese-like domain-containing protein [Maritimibacter harenae]
MAEMLALAALSANPDRFHLIDVRDAEDYAAAHVAGAVHIPLSDLEARRDKLPPGTKPVTICGKGGGRSAEGADMLCNLGRPDALWLEGGTTGWLAQNT